MTENRPEYGELKRPTFCVKPVEIIACSSPEELASLLCGNNRPIEDALRAQIADLTARNKHLEWDLEQAERRGDDLARRLEGKA